MEILKNMSTWVWVLGEFSDEENPNFGAISWSLAKNNPDQELPVNFDLIIHQFFV